MKRLCRIRAARPHRGASLTDALVAFGLSTLVIALVLAGVARALDLYASDVGSLVAQEEIRMALMRLETDLRNSASPPVLLDETGSVVSGSGPAAGIRFHRVVGGPHAVHNGASAASTRIRVRTGPFVPRAGDAIEIPTHGVRRVLTRVAAEAATPTVRTLHLDAPLGVDVVVDPGRQEGSVIAYFTRSVEVRVESNELRQTPGNRPGSAFDLLARNVESPSPFRLEAHRNGGTPAVVIELACAPSSGARTRARREVVVLRAAATPRAPWSIAP